FFLLLIFLSFIPYSAQATSGHEFDIYFVSINFSDKYFDKKVKAVYAHVGVLMQKRFDISGGSSNERYWTAIKHLKMDAKEGHFFQKIELAGEFHTHYGDTLIGPVIQYWITLEDGSEVKTQDYLVPIAKPIPNDSTSMMGDRDALQKSSLYKDKKEQFDNTTDADKTQAVRIYASYAS
ncbi:MAG: hypothetical protein WCG27_09830, partial [Pseudomonadota bacterium]